MSTVVRFAIGYALLAAAALPFVIALCRAAARGDRIIEEEERRINEAHAAYDLEPPIGFTRERR